jgi:hypothetical protein
MAELPRPREGGQDATEAADVLAEPVDDRGARPGVEDDPRPVELFGEPVAAALRVAGRAGVDPGASGPVDCVGEHLRHPTAAPFDHQVRSGRGVRQVLHQGSELRCGEAGQPPRDHDPAVGEERNRLCGVDELVDGVVLTGEVLEQQTPIIVSDQLVDDGTDRVGEQGRLGSRQELHRRTGHEANLPGPIDPEAFAVG